MSCDAVTLNSIYAFLSHFSHESMVCLAGSRVESRIVSPGHSKGNKVTKQSPVATLTQRRTTPFDVSLTFFICIYMYVVVCGLSRQ